MFDHNKTEFSAALLYWYDQHRRHLPWREDPTAYHVWVSEIMLQQTRVEAVLGYYDRFMKACPDIRSLAAASEDTYMKLWEGLGYYSRVRHLHDAAVLLVDQYNANLPDTYAALRELPGIGDYTAAAIASIAFGEAVPAVDGNLLRIFARLTEYPSSIKDSAAKKAAFAWYQERIPKNRPGDFNQALMDIGATICLPHGAPECAHCPLADFCAAKKNGTWGSYPVMLEKKARRVENRTVLLIHDKVHILIDQRPEKGLLAGLYEFPNVEGHLSEEALPEALSALKLPIVSIRKAPDAKHIFTHLEWHMIGYDITVASLDAWQKAKNHAKFESDLEAADHINVPAAKQVLQSLLPVHFEKLSTEYAIPSAFAIYKNYIGKIS